LGRGPQFPDDGDVIRIRLAGFELVPGALAGLAGWQRSPEHQRERQGEEPNATFSFHGSTPGPIAPRRGIPQRSLSSPCTTVQSAGTRGGANSASGIATLASAFR